jgi:hypothetical protein
MVALRASVGSVVYCFHPCKRKRVVRIHLGGHLNWYDSEKRAWLELTQPQPIALMDLARRLGVPVAEIAIATVNRRAVDLATAAAAEGDTVEFFSPIGGG